MSANVNKSWDDVCHRGEKLEQRAKFLKREVLSALGQQISEASTANDNQGAKKWPDEFEKLDRRIETQHAEISRLMHARNADPRNEMSKVQLEAAFAALKKLEQEWVEALKPYQEVETPLLSEADRQNIEEARQILAMYKNENHT